MNESERTSLVGLYSERVAELGYDVRSLGWKSREEQTLRFQVLADIADLTNSTVCDMGCGFGDLLPYLTDRFGTVQYHGVDICRDLLEIATRRRPDIRFSLADILSPDFSEHAHWHLLSGA